MKLIENNTQSAIAYVSEILSRCEEENLRSIENALLASRLLNYSFCLVEDYDKKRDSIYIQFLKDEKEIGLFISYYNVKNPVTTLIHNTNENLNLSSTNIDEVINKLIEIL